MTWIKILIGEFLTERKGRFKPDSDEIKGLKRIEKIDFSGQIFLSEKVSKTTMIKIKKGDLVISGINVEKGALNIYEGDEDITATIHYSSYQFDSTKVNLNFFKIFVQSKAFRNALKEQVAGGIKTELKAKHLLPLEIWIPKSIESQDNIVQQYYRKKLQRDLIQEELSSQINLISQLRQVFLREAMQGELVSNETSDGATGEQLLEEIKAEKKRLIKEKKIRPSKPLAPISEDEIPFEIPENWVWCRLGEVIEHTFNRNIQKELDPDEIVHYVDIDSIDNINFKIREPKRKKVRELSSRARRVLQKDFLIYSTVRPYLRNVAIIENHLENHIGTTGCEVFLPLLSSNKFFLFFLISPDLNISLQQSMIGFNSPGISKETFANILVPLPPIEIQKRIVSKLESLIAYCDELEESVKRSQEINEILLQQILREALEPEKEMHEIK